MLQSVSVVVRWGMSVTRHKLQRERHTATPEEKDLGGSVIVLSYVLMFLGLAACDQGDT